MSDTPETAADDGSLVAAADSSSAVAADTAVATDSAASPAVADASAADAASADAAGDAAGDDSDEADGVEELAHLKALSGDESELVVEVLKGAVSALEALGCTVAGLAEHLVASVKHLVSPFESQVAAQATAATDAANVDAQ